MKRALKQGFAGVLAVFLVAGTALPSYAIMPGIRQNPYQSLLDATSGGNNGIGSNPSIAWPSDSIDFSQIQKLFSQFPGANKLNIQFPNQLNWQVTPGGLQSILSNFNQEAATMGVDDNKLPQLVFSSLAGGGLKTGLAQLSIESLKNGGNPQQQIDDIMRQLRYSDLNLSDKLPDWMKEWIVSVYDMVYQAMNYAGALLASLMSHR